MTLRLLLLSLTPLILLSGTASASTEAAEKLLHSAVAEVMDATSHAPNSAALAVSVRPILEKYVSFDSMTRRAVGPGWRQFTVDQQKQATRLFTTLIIRTYSSKFTPGEIPTIKFRSAVSPVTGRVEVPTTVLYHGNYDDVTYRLEDEGGWRITDMVVEGVSLIANYRPQFDEQFKQGGVKAVIDSLSRSVSSEH